MQHVISNNLNEVSILFCVRVLCGLSFKQFGVYFIYGVCFNS